MNEWRYGGLEAWDHNSTKIAGPTKISNLTLRGKNIQLAEGLATLEKFKVQSVIVASVSV